MLLDQGRVIASGPHQELLNTEPRYRDVLAAMEAAEAEAREGDDSASAAVATTPGGGD
mgnify:FL=1